MRILAIDTATEACSAALWNDGTLSAHFEICPREHTQRILPLVQEVLTESGTTLRELEALAAAGKSACKANAAVARELACWVWEIGCRSEGTVL